MMQLTQVTFDFDSIAHVFPAIRLKLHVDNHPELSTEQIIQQVKYNMGQIESFFDRILFARGISKVPTASETAGGTSLGHMYHSNTLPKEFFYEFQYYLYSKSNDHPILHAEVEIYLKSSKNTNYFFLLEFLQDFSMLVSVKAYLTIDSMHKKYRAKKDSMSSSDAIYRPLSRFLFMREEYSSILEDDQDNRQELLQQIIQQDKLPLKKLKFALGRIRYKGIYHKYLIFLLCSFCVFLNICLIYITTLVIMK